MKKTLEAERWEVRERKRCVKSKVIAIRKSDIFISPKKGFFKQVSLCVNTSPRFVTLGNKRFKRSHVLDKNSKNSRKSFNVFSRNNSFKMTQKVNITCGCVCV